ncbi:MAG TPA: hypothetical protein VKU92_06485 [Acidimicrobiales bacterium]|nr:hypothetical protein [Acidimicrobiales bacterium]
MTWFAGSADASAEEQDASLLAKRLLEVRRGLLDLRSELTARLASLSAELERIGAALESMQDRAAAASSPGEVAPEPLGAALAASATVPAAPTSEEVSATPELEADPAASTLIAEAPQVPLPAAAEHEPAPEPEFADPTLEPSPGASTESATSHLGEIEEAMQLEVEAAETEAAAGPAEAELSVQEHGSPVRAGERPSPAEEPEATVAPLSAEQQLDQLLAEEFAVYRSAPSPPSVAELEADRGVAPERVEESSEPHVPPQAQRPDTATDDFFANRGH